MLGVSVRRCSTAPLKTSSRVVSLCVPTCECLWSSLHQGSSKVSRGLGVGRVLRDEIAFEYDGEQHFKFPNWFHKSQEAFQLQADDAKKTLLCEQHGISSMCSILGQVQGASRVCEYAVGIRFHALRSVGKWYKHDLLLHGASLAKKTIFAKHYKQLVSNLHTRLNR